METGELDQAGAVDALAYQRGRLAGVFTSKLLVSQRRDFNLNVYAVEQRAGDFGAIALDLRRRAAAFFLRDREKSARARIDFSKRLPPPKISGKRPGGSILSDILT